jgi:hypothetical protein
VAHSTSQTAFLTLEKSFPYRGAREHWSNAYHLDNIPSSDAIWSNLAAQIWDKERAFLPSEVQWEYSYGHTPGTPPVLVWEADEPPVGEGGTAGAFVPIPSDDHTPGDVAMWIRYSTTQKNTLGKPIYLRNYFHGVYCEPGSDTVSAGQRAALDLFGTAFVAGFPSGGTTFRRAGPRGAVAQGHLVGQFATTRTLKHRGRRHRWSPGTAPTGYKWILTNVPQEIN